MKYPGDSEMLITVNCKTCKVDLEADDSLFGRNQPCPNCSQPIEIPQAHVGPGVTIGQYGIVDFLGQGGMGQVFVAKQTALE